MEIRKPNRATRTFTQKLVGPQGDSFVAGFTEEFYAGFMKEWETRMNHYLKTGERLRTAG